MKRQQPEHVIFGLSISSEAELKKALTFGLGHLNMSRQNLRNCDGHFLLFLSFYCL